MTGDWQVVALVGDERGHHPLERRFSSDAAAAVFVLALQDALEADERDEWVEANLGWLAPALREGAVHELCITPA